MDLRARRALSCFCALQRHTGMLPWPGQALRARQHPHLCRILGTGMLPEDIAAASMIWLTTSDISKMKVSQHNWGGGSPSPVRQVVFAFHGSSSLQGLSGFCALQRYIGRLPGPGQALRADMSPLHGILGTGMLPGDIAQASMFCFMT